MYISKVEPALALWMMTAGVSLLLTTTVAFIAIVAKRSTKTDSADQEGKPNILLPSPLPVHEKERGFDNLAQITLPYLRR